VKSQAAEKKESSNETKNAAINREGEETLMKQSHLTRSGTLKANLVWENGEEKKVGALLSLQGIPGANPSVIPFHLVVKNKEKGARRNCTLITEVSWLGGEGGDGDIKKSH